jgi:hypothetical protein
MDLGVKRGSRFKSRKIRLSKEQDAPRRRGFPPGLRSRREVTMVSEL